MALYMHVVCKTRYARLSILKTKPVIWKGYADRYAILLAGIL